MMDILSAQWLAAKKMEKEAIENRRAIEDKIIALNNFNIDMDHTETVKRGCYTIQMAGRLNRKVDGAKLQQIAQENKISNEILQELFRWKPEINMKEWKNAPTVIINALSAAVTTSSGRPSVSIEIKD
jgi:hypothetical protein